MHGPILYGQIPHPNSTFHSIFFAVALPNACTATVHTKVYNRHSARLHMNKVTLHHITMYLMLTAEYLSKCMHMIPLSLF